MKKILITAISVVSLLLSSAYAQETEAESKFGYSVGTDVVSSYVFRGATCSDGIAIQPGAEISYAGLAFGVWASSDLDGVTSTGVPSEADLYLSYSIGGFSAGFTHYYYFGKSDFFGSGTQTEAKVAYTISEKFPLSITWNTMIGGSDKYIDDEGEEKRAYSTYIELGYSHSLVKDLSLSYAVGVSPWKSVYSGFTKDVVVPNVSVSLDYELELGDACTMGTFLQPVYNTYSGNFACVLGCGFWF